MLTCKPNFAAGVCWMKAFKLARHRDGQWRPLVQKLMIPIQYLFNLQDPTITSLGLFHNLRKAEEEERETLEVRYCHITQLDEIFDRMETKLTIFRSFPKLPTRSDEWNSDSIPAWDRMAAPGYSSMDVNVIKTLLQLKISGLPFKRAQRNKWTETQRTLAGNAPVATSLEDLREKLDDMHAGLVLVETDSGMCRRQSNIKEKKMNTITKHQIPASSQTVKIKVMDVRRPNLTSLRQLLP
ncbi:hypothetical protein B0H13DRAFT_1855956 [Mycena leptocephala]|nr:hypothetical protein B0H13DRAFT_1855956 [Mycena leptocephala]